MIPHAAVIRGGMALVSAGSPRSKAMLLLCIDFQGNTGAREKEMDLLSELTHRYPDTWHTLGVTEDSIQVTTKFSLRYRLGVNARMLHRVQSRCSRLRGPTRDSEPMSRKGGAAWRRAGIVPVGLVAISIVAG